jgi:hypothetical protein
MGDHAARRETSSKSTQWRVRRAASESEDLRDRDPRVASVLRLQRAIGNQAVSRMVGGLGLQREAAPNTAEELPSKPTGAMTQPMSPQYLGLQHGMDPYNRRLTLLANIFQSRHEDAENMIENMR